MTTPPPADEPPIGYCQHPTVLDRYGNPTATCGAPAVEYRPTRELVRYVCADHR